MRMASTELAAAATISANMEPSDEDIDDSCYIDEESVISIDSSKSQGSSTPSMPTASNSTTAEADVASNYCKWSREEDDRLREAISRFGDTCWKKVADFVQTRNNSKFCPLISLLCYILHPFVLNFFDIAILYQFQSLTKLL